MARIMSSVFAVFTIVPVFAPAAGNVVADLAGWSGVFWLTVILAGVVALWTTRLGETGPAGLSGSSLLGAMGRGALGVICHRSALYYMIAMTLSFGAFFPYMATSELLFADAFSLGHLFPYIYGGIAALMSLAMFANAALVERLKAERVVLASLLIYLIGSLILMGGTVVSGGIPSATFFVVSLAIIAAMHGLVITNLNSLALDPMGDMAGTASSVISAMSTGGGALVGSLIDSGYDGTVRVLSIGFVVAAAAALLLCLMARRYAHR